MYYSLNREGLEDLEDFIEEFKKTIPRPCVSRKCE